MPSTRQSTISERGASIAASHFGITVAEYREHEARDEHHCSDCKTWKEGAAFPSDAHRPRGVGNICRACMVPRAAVAYRRQVVRDRAAEQRQRVSGISYAGPAFSLTPEREATVSRADSAWSEPAASCAQPVVVLSGHSHAWCPAVLGCREGRIPAGWVRAS